MRGGVNIDTSRFNNPNVPTIITGVSIIVNAIPMITHLTLTILTIRLTDTIIANTVQTMIILITRITISVVVLLDLVIWSKVLDIC